MLNFIASISHDLQAVAALGSGCLTRSLQHYELAYAALEEEEAIERKEAVAEGLLAAYESLGELDGVEGVRRALLAKDHDQSLAMQRVSCFFHSAIMFFCVKLLLSNFCQ